MGGEDRRRRLGPHDCTEQSQPRLYVVVDRPQSTSKAIGRGSFVLQHYGVMNGADGPLTITVVPGAGTGELEGLSGELSIEMVEGKHHYRFDYVL